MAESELEWVALHPQKHLCVGADLMTTGIAPAEPAIKRPRLGLFEVQERIVHANGPANHIVLKVCGADETPFAGISGIATCLTKPTDEQAVVRLQDMLDA